MSECYVCTDIAYTLSPCKCKNLYLHDDCYGKLLAYDNKHCGVCLEPFPLPDLEAPEIYIKPPETVHKVELLCVPILMGRRAIGMKDSIVEPLRHMVYLVLLFNVLKLIIFPSTYTFTFDVATPDILISTLTIFIYGCFILTVRGVYIRYNSQ